MHRHPGCYGTLPICCLMGATVRCWSRGRRLEEVEEEEEEEEEEKVGGVLLYVHISGTFVKWTLSNAPSLIV
ncbi:hypothetical protein VN97_g4863 [Penicillium thymicola]|uniref:Uncharacterized protein n=1 Tax=Penicillium thymicola TaxID=293382 RepID=A0AAI9X942_PENTH|nr:hypothetical protein VN97_g4863 [Penicillium thymicola]